MMRGSDFGNEFYLKTGVRFGDDDARKLGYRYQSPVIAVAVYRILEIHNRGMTSGEVARSLDEKGPRLD
jgi:hypothetical protein